MYLNYNIHNKYIVFIYMKFYSIIVSSLLTVCCESFQFHIPPHSQYFFPFTSSNIEKWEHFQEERGKDIVLSVSSMLPKFDTVGHNILSANHDFIQDVLGNPQLDHETKKSIILFSIKLAQYGDDMGSIILQKYYNLVESCL